MNSFLSRLGIIVLRESTYRGLVASSILGPLITILKTFPVDPEVFSTAVQNTKSQLGQDFFALAVNSGKRSGYFVEFGATNGQDLSNTWLLEKHFAWTGILAEPAWTWHEDLEKNRSARISKDAVWVRSGETIEFLETKHPELSTISGSGLADQHKRKGKTYKVETTTLLDLLVNHEAPAEIDFLSIDTEGSEFEILSGFDFSKYSFNAICVEHNFTSMEKNIQELLEFHGYVRVLEKYSKFDAWYVPRSLVIGETD